MRKCNESFIVPLFQQISVCCAIKLCKYQKVHFTSKSSSNLFASLIFTPDFRNRRSREKSYSNSGHVNQRWYVLAGATAVGAACLEEKYRKTGKKNVNSCGIVAYLGDRDADEILLEGMQILQNRGYDSCGLSTINPAGQIITTKRASQGSTCDCIQIVKRDAKKSHAGHHIGIAHTRWATHGAKTDSNAHPHHDYKDRISLIHNGTIENYAELKKKLLDAGIQFKSETDTEVISNLIGYYLDKELSFEDSVTAAINELEGTWGLCVIHKDHKEKLILARNGSPLLVGTSEGQVFVASEPAALVRHTNHYLSLKDGEIAVITQDGIDQLSATRQLQKIQMEQIELSPAPFEYWTEKEIFEQPQSLARALNYGGRISPCKNAIKLGGLDNNKESLLEVKNMVIAGCGTSLYAGIYGQLLMEYLSCFDSCRAIDASEINSQSFPKNHAGLLLLSQSGETLDTVRACQVGDSLGITKLSIVNVVGSLLARLTNCGVYLNAGREVAVASTKAFTSQVTVLALVAAWFAQNKPEQCFSYDRLNTLMDALHRLPVYAGMTLGNINECRKIAEKLKHARSIFILGKGYGYPAALEGALKIKEMSYVHAEGFAGGALKHGPFALIDEKEKTPVVLLVFSDQHLSLMKNAAQQVKARGAHVVCITDDQQLVKDVADDIVVVPNNGPLTALLGAMCLQMLAYEMSRCLNLNPDNPRGLAKAVTVL